MRREELKSRLDERRPKRGSSYLETLRNIEKEQEAVLGKSKPIIPTIAFQKTKYSVFTEFRKRRILHEHLTQENFFHESTRQFNKTTSKFPIPIQLQNRHAIVAVEDDKADCLIVRNNPPPRKQNNEFRIRIERRAKSSMKVRSEKRPSRPPVPLYEYCVMCNDKNQKYVEAMKGISTEAQEKLRHEWNKDFFEDF